MNGGGGPQIIVAPGDEPPEKPEVPDGHLLALHEAIYRGLSLILAAYGKWIRARREAHQRDGLH